MNAPSKKLDEMIKEKAASMYEMLSMGGFEIKHSFALEAMGESVARMIIAEMERISMSFKIAKSPDELLYIDGINYGLDCLKQWAKPMIVEATAESEAERSETIEGE